MFDIARVVALLFALAACARPRYRMGMLASAVLAGLLAWEIGAPLARHAVGSAGVGSGFAFVFLGPSGVEPRPWVTALQALLAGTVSAVAFARSRPLRPEGDVARAWDTVGLRFLFVAALHGLLVVLDVLLARLMRDP